MKKPPPTVAIDRMRGQSPKEPPPPFEGTLRNGQHITWRMPDPFTLIAFDGMVPDPVTAAVIDLLTAEKSYVPDDAPLRHRHEAQHIKGLYGLAAAMLVEPRLDVAIEYGANGTLGRREIGYQDVVDLYWLFRVGVERAPATPADSDQPERTTNAPPDRADVPQDTSGADGG